jgi:AraC family transcriptional regulator of adaptative response/methylated-DNA-[protein]-cysteine methyltransferase
MLDGPTCERAWLARDPAYDGRFFIGVRTTGLYCRCVCPVRLPLRRNIEFHPSAAAAERAGFRPCLRCRPEAAPTSAAWKGTRAIVERAARLIAAGALDGDDGASVEDLAARVGVGARHLRRLFRRHLGATLSQVARTARVQRAKRLLDTTDLPMSQVALAAGFGSQRRFLAVFSEVYRRPPTDLRRCGVPQEHAVAPTPRAVPCPKTTDAGSNLRRRVVGAAAQ